MFTVAKEHTLPARPDLNAELRAVFVPPTAAMLSAAALVFATATICAALPAEPQLKWRELAAEDKHRCALHPPPRCGLGCRAPAGLLRGVPLGCSERLRRVSLQGCTARTPTARQWMDLPGAIIIYRDLPRAIFGGK